EHHLLEDRGQVELLEGRDLGVDQPDDAADRRLLHEGAHPEAPDARRGDREVAFLVASNSRVCRSFMMARTSVADCSTVSARSLCGRISPSSLIAGGKPAVMNRSEAFFSVTRRSRSCISLMA